MVALTKKSIFQLIKTAKSAPESAAVTAKKDGWTALAFWTEAMAVRWATISSFFGHKSMSFDEIATLTESQFRSCLDAASSAFTKQRSTDERMFEIETRRTAVLSSVKIVFGASS